MIDQEKDNTGIKETTDAPLENLVDHYAALGMKRRETTPGNREGILGKRIDLHDDLPDAPRAEFVSTPLEDFAEKLLNYMGKGDKTIGTEARRPIKPVQFNPRPENLGLGAIPKKEVMDKIKNGQIVSDKDLRSKAYRSVSYIGQESGPRDQPGMKYGDHVRVLVGKYEGLCGIVVEYDEEEDRCCTVQLDINKKNVTVLTKQIEKLDNNQLQKETEVNKESGLKEEEKEEKKRKKIRWILPGIRLQVVSKKYRGGRYFEEIGRVEDVLDERSFTFITMKGEMLEDLEEKHLETIMPKVGEKIMVLKGENRGSVGVLHELKKKENKLVVRIERNVLEYVDYALDDCCSL